MLNTLPSWKNTSTSINITSQISAVTANNKKLNLPPWPSVCLCQWKTFIVPKWSRRRWCHCWELKPSSTLQKSTSSWVKFYTRTAELLIHLYFNETLLIPTPGKELKHWWCSVYSIPPGVHLSIKRCGCIVASLYNLCNRDRLIVIQSAQTNLNVSAAVYIIYLHCLQFLLCCFQMKL